MSAATEPRWYSVNNMGMATLCADKKDAEDVASTCDMEWPRQGQHRAVQLVEAPKIHYPMAEPVAWMWRVADSDWQLESTCPPERPLAIVEPLYTGYMADAYIGAMEEVEIWKRRALEEEKKLQAEIARLTAENEALKAAVSEAVAEERTLSADNSMIAVYTSPQRREPLTDDAWLNYVLRHGTKTDVHIATFEAVGRVTRLRNDANNLRKLVEAAHGIGAKP